MTSTVREAGHTNYPGKPDNQVSSDKTDMKNECAKYHFVCVAVNVC